LWVDVVDKLDEPCDLDELNVVLKSPNSSPTS
jgi:hypothetical protein